jgi:hypothetical protein
MTAGQSWKSNWLERGAISYLLICLGALVVLYYALIDLGMEGWGLLPVLVGLLGLGLRWSLAPLMVLFALALGMLADAESWLLTTPATLRIPEFIVCGAVLAYALAHFRLTMIPYPFPTDQPAPRPRWARKRTLVDSPVVPIKRAQPDGPMASSREIGLLVLSLPLWAGLAQLVWPLLPFHWDSPGLRPSVWRGMLLVWTIGGLGLLAAVVLDYWYRATMSVDEATLILQDTLWKETRREQRRISRWYAYGHIHPERGFWRDLRANPFFWLLLLIGMLLAIVLLFGGEPNP